jgi:hypothetical protein
VPVSSAGLFHIGQEGRETSDKFCTVNKKSYL